jgi:hypothetical protein
LRPARRVRFRSRSALRCSVEIRTHVWFRYYTSRITDNGTLIQTHDILLVVAHTSEMWGQASKLQFPNNHVLLLCMSSPIRQFYMPRLSTPSRKLMSATGVESLLLLLPAREMECQLDSNCYHSCKSAAMCSCVVWLLSIFKETKVFVPRSSLFFPLVLKVKYKLRVNYSCQHFGRVRFSYKPYFFSQFSLPTKSCSIFVFKNNVALGVLGKDIRHGR